MAPLLTEIARQGNFQLRIEYPLTVNDWLKGTLDYLLRSRTSLTIVEANRDDLSRGFVQLAVELIALAQLENAKELYGAATIGEAWKFARLDTKHKTITQDINLYRVPADLEAIAAILLGVLRSEN